MSGMLASVSNLEEALLTESCKVDIIDLKQPARGALGALEIGEVKAIVAALNAETCISATVGDLPMQADILFDAVQAMAATGVDYVKIGFFPGGDWLACIDRLAEISRYHALIAVLFADTQPDFAIIEKLSQAGFRGVMLDTMDKTAGSLTHFLPPMKLLQFVETARGYLMLTGLAGSLRQHDIPGLQALEVDYLGFRGALCHQHQRTAQLDSNRIVEIRDCLQRLKQSSPAVA
jgi:uncharacterized protein (UPF0264 family)